jgi:hypothetical protein
MLTVSSTQTATEQLKPELPKSCVDATITAVMGRTITVSAESDQLANVLTFQQAIDNVQLHGEIKLHRNLVLQNNDLRVRY